MKFYSSCLPSYESRRITRTPCREFRCCLETRNRGQKMRHRTLNPNFFHWKTTARLLLACTAIFLLEATSPACKACSQKCFLEIATSQEEACSQNLLLDMFPSPMQSLLGGRFLSYPASDEGVSCSLIMERVKRVRTRKLQPLRPMEGTEIIYKQQYKCGLI